VEGCDHEVVSLFLPDWPIDRWKRVQGASRQAEPEANPGENSPDAPLVLVQRIGNRRLIYAATIGCFRQIRPQICSKEPMAVPDRLSLDKSFLKQRAGSSRKPTTPSRD
jgi:hypothetical protein